MPREKEHYQKNCNEKKDRWTTFGCNNDRLFPEKLIHYGRRIGKMVY